MSYYKNNALGKALDAVVETIRRKPTDTEISLIVASSCLAFNMYQYGDPKDLPPNKVGRACALAIFRTIALNRDDSNNSITEFYRKALAYRQSDLDEQMIKAIEKSQNDVIYDSSTVRAMIIGTRKCLYEKIGLDARNFEIQGLHMSKTPTKHTMDIKEQADAIIDPKLVLHGLKMTMFYAIFMEEDNGNEANSLIMLG